MMHQSFASYRTLLLALIVIGMLLVPYVQAQRLQLNSTNRSDAANLVYDPSTGDVVLGGIETESGQIISFAIMTASDNKLENLDSVNFPFPDTGQNTDLSLRQVGQFQDTIESEGFTSHVLGPVFPTGMDLAQLMSFVEVGIYASDRGIGGNFDAVLLSGLSPGDFDGNAAVDITDVVLLCDSLTHGMSHSMLDLSADEQVDASDLTQLQTLANLLPGDANGDSSVDFADFLVLSSNFSSMGDYRAGDFSCNGDVAFEDFLGLSANFGRTSNSVTTRSVPEPNIGWRRLCCC